jgi:uncharacterized protein YjiK
MKFILGIVAVLAVAGFAFRDSIQDALFKDSKAGQAEYGEKKGKKKDKPEAGVQSGVRVEKKWELPEVLTEISGLAFLDKGRFVCVQDEKGSLFIYNTATEKIEKEIPFGAPGDYEGVTLSGNTAYVVRADGRLFEITGFDSQPSVKEYNTPLTADDNIEGLFYDAANNRLLLAAKDGKGTGGRKNVYEFSLASKKLADAPAYSIDPSDGLLGSQGKKKFSPSAIAIHPSSKELYIVDGPQSRLLVMDPSGRMKKVYQLGREFVQPEGITFTPEGDLYISSEGKKSPGTILKVQL